MISSATQDFLSDVLSGGRIPGGKLAYFQTRLAGNVHQAMLKVFGRLERQGTFTRRELAQRIGRKPEQITRWFSYPGNLTLSTVSDIFIGMGYELESITLVDLATGKRLQCPDHHVDWVRLAGLYDHEQESYVAPPSEPRQRSALSGQTKQYESIAEWPSFDQPAKHSALRGCLPPSSGPRKAAAAQLQTMGTRASGTQIGQEA
jgi:hypothetical protein